jgi:hypothetical protein
VRIVSCLHRRSKFVTFGSPTALHFSMPFFFPPFWAGVELSPLLLRSLLSYGFVPSPDGDCGAVGGMLGRGSRSTRRKPTPVPFCPPQIPHDLIHVSNLGSWKPSTNRLSYGTALSYTYCIIVLILKLVVCILLRVLGQVQGSVQTSYNSTTIIHVQGFRLTQHWLEYFIQ